MMKRILMLKHWQLFLLIFIPILWQPIYFDLEDLIFYIGPFTYLFWIYSIGVYGRKQIKLLELPQPNFNLFTINVLLIPYLHLIGIILSTDFLSDIYYADSYISPLTIKKLIVYSYLVFSIIQTACFICKILKTIELGREVHFRDYFQYIPLMTFLFVGIWFLQPKISRILDIDNKTKNS